MKNILTSVLKIAGFVLIFPLILAFFIAFQTQILSLPLNKEVWILWGAGTYVLLNLFVYNFKELFDGGRAQVEKLFSFFKPAGYIVPVYAILLIVIYIIILVLGHTSWQPYFLFGIAFCLAMHLILTAQEIYQADNSVLKAHYLIVFGIIFIANVFVMSMLLAWAVPEYSLVGFVKSLAHQTSHLYRSVYKTLFVD